MSKLKDLHDAATPGWVFYKDKLRPKFSTKIIEIQDQNGNAIIKWSGFDCVDRRTKKETEANARIAVYLRNHAAAIIELQDAAKVMRAFQRGDGPYDYQAQCDAEDRFDAALAKMEE